MSNYKTFPIIGTKSSLLWDEDTDAWVYMSGAPVRDEQPREYIKTIPTLFRGVDIRASSIANLPWALMKGETEFDTSDDYQNKAGLVSSMYTMLYLIEASLVLQGCSYWKREKNRAGYDKLRHLDPTSMALQEENASKGELVWKRNEGSTTREYTTKEIIYLWYPDPYVEIGPPSTWPVKSALNACGVLVNVDEFAKTYFARGAIKATLFAMQGGSKQEAEKFESWWNRFVSGIKNANKTKVVNAEKVEPIVVGEGIKELENVTLSQEKREEIALSLAIPMSILFANAANYATAERDKLNWYEDKVVPEANLIASLLNEQVFAPLGLRLVFKPETLDIFQEDEAQRAAAMSQFMDALDKAGDWEMAQALLKIYGVEADEESMGWIEAHFTKKEEQAAEIQANIANAQQEQPQEDEPQEEKPPFPAKDLQQVQRELSLWQKKCLSALKRGEVVNFVPVSIPLDIYNRIASQLDGLGDAEAVKNVFATAFSPETPLEPSGGQDPMMMIAMELKRANDLLESTAASEV